MKRVIRAVTEDLANQYSITDENGQWYVMVAENNDIAAGPFDTKQEAADWIFSEEPSVSEGPEVEDKKPREYWLNWFDKYSNKIPGKFYATGHVCTRNYTALSKFVKAFNKKNPDANIEINTGCDSDGPFYTVI